MKHDLILICIVLQIRVGSRNFSLSISLSVSGCVLSCLIFLCYFIENGLPKFRFSISLKDDDYGELFITQQSHEGNG